MCLLVAAYDAHPDYHLVLVGHRDEFHARPAAALGWWPDAPDVLAGRDLAAGGTWLGTGRDGRVAVVTNYRASDALRPDGPSRGRLVPEFLDSRRSSEDFCHSLAGRAGGLSGFNLLTFDGDGLAYCANRPVATATRLGPGVYGLSNATLDTPWPKLLRARERVRSVLTGRRFHSSALFAAVTDRRTAADADLPDTGLPLEWERRLSAPFIVSPDYGTRCTTVVLVGRDGRVQVEERRHGPDGETTGRTVMVFHRTRLGSAAS